MTEQDKNLIKAKLQDCIDAADRLIYNGLCTETDISRLEILKSKQIDYMNKL